MKTTKLIAPILVLAALLEARAASTVTFDNQSGLPALVKLLGPTSTSVQVETGKKETVTTAAGHYHIKVRYGTPGKYAYSKGDEFDVSETATSLSQTTITLHAVVDGNYGTRGISQEEFGLPDESKDKRTSPVEPAVLKDAIASSGRTGTLPLTQGYRGESRVVARTGAIAKLDIPDKPYVMEFTHVNFGFRGPGDDWRSVLAIGVGPPLDDGFIPLSSVYMKDLPTVEHLKGLKTAEEFERVFAGFAFNGKQYADGSNHLHVPRMWRAFTLRPDGSVRCIDVMIFTVFRGPTPTLDGSQISEAILKPTGKPPEFRK